MEKSKSTILDCFPKLINGSDKQRIDSGVLLVKYFSELKWDDDSSNELHLALKRLIRGTGSSRVTARKSFYITLTAYLTSNSDTPVEKVLEIMEVVLQPVSSSQKAENGDIYTGRILTCGSLIRSKILQKCPAEEQQKVLEHIISAGKKKSYLSFLAYSFVIDFLTQINKKNFANNVWPFLREELMKPWSEQNLDTLHALIIIQDKFPSVVSESFKEVFENENIINAESLQSITKILTDIPRILCVKHPVYKLFIEKLSETEYVQTFWAGIDQRFLKPSKTDEFLGAEILKLLLETVENKSLIPELLSEKYIQYMLRKCKFNKKNQKDDAITAFKNALASLPVIMKDNVENKIKITTLKRLIIYPGDLMIERLTGLKIIQLFTSGLNTDGVKKLSKTYIEIINNLNDKKKENESESESPQAFTNAERVYAAQLLTKLLSHPEIIADHSWRLKQLKYLFQLGLCEFSNVGVELASTIKVSFYRALDNKLPKLSDLRSVLNNFVSYLDEELFTEDNLKLRTPLEEAGIEAWKKMKSLARKCEKNDDKFSTFFHTMDLHMGLQLFNDPEMAISSIDELYNCYQRLKKKSRKSKSSSEEDEPEWTEVIVDLLLSLLSRSEHLLRTVVRIVFPHICPHLTSASLHQILEVLDVKNTKGPLSVKGTENEDSSGSEAESENEDDKKDDEDDEKEDKNAESDSDKDSEDDDEDDDDDDDDNGDGADDDEFMEEETMTDRLRLVVRQALGDAAAQNGDDMDVDDIDEEEGKRLNESLAAAFKILRESRRSQNKKQDKPAEILTHFRIRVIDLLEIYLDSCPPMALALDMVVPLFMLLEFCIKEPHQKPLEDKVKSLLKKLSGLKKFKDTENVDSELLTTLMKILMERGERSASICQGMGDQLAKCCMLLVRCSQQANLPMEDLAAIYKDHLTAFFKKRDSIISVFFFKNILQICWEGNWVLVPLLVEFAFDSEIRSFRRCFALELLLVFYRNARILQGEEHKDTRLKLEKKLCKRSIKLLQELGEVQSNVSETTKGVNSLGKEIKPKFVQELFTLLHVIRSRYIPQAWDWEKIAESMALYRQNTSVSTDVQASYKKLASQIGAPIKFPPKKKEAKTKTEAVNGNELQNGTEVSIGNEKSEENALDTSLNAKKKKKKEKQKLKKEAHKLISEAMSEDVEPCLINRVGLQNGTENSIAEEESEENEQDSSLKAKKKKKKNHNQKEKHKLKKEARKLRAEAMSEGLETFDFSSVVLPNNTHETEVEDEEAECKETTKVSKKHKRNRHDSPSRPSKKKKVSKSET